MEKDTTYVASISLISTLLLYILRHKMRIMPHDIFDVRFAVGILHRLDIEICSDLKKLQEVLY